MAADSTVGEDGRHQSELIPVESNWDVTPRTMSNDNASGSKKTAWNKPLNGVVESSSVMGGATFWPALSESTKPTPKSSSDASKPGSDSTSQAPLPSETIQRQINSNANANSTTNHGLPRQRTTRHRGSGGPAQILYNRPPPPPPPLPTYFPAVELSPYNNFGNFVAPVVDTLTPVRGGRPMGGLGPQSGSDHSWQPQRSSSRRNGFYPRPRSDGQHYQNNGGRRDSDHMPHQFIPPGPYMPPPPPPPNMRPFITPMSYDMAPPYMLVPTLGPESFRGMPFIAQAPAAPMYFPTMSGLHLANMIVNQIDYYFSDANLVGNDHLKSYMDKEGWVPIDLIASFSRVQQLTSDIQLILECLGASMVVEVQGDKLRRRGDWYRWLPVNIQTSANPGTQPPTTILSDDSLSASIERMSLSVENSSSPRGGGGGSMGTVTN